jgi:hypothetical protein
MLMLLVDVFAIQFLARPAARTFSNVGPVAKDTFGR